MCICGRHDFTSSAWIRGQHDLYYYQFFYRWLNMDIPLRSTPNVSKGPQELTVPLLTNSAEADFGAHKTTFRCIPYSWFAWISLTSLLARTRMHPIAIQFDLRAAVGPYLGIFRTYTAVGSYYSSLTTGEGVLQTQVRLLRKSSYLMKFLAHGASYTPKFSIVILRYKKTRYTDAI